jgi:SAM-dependent methyltransferase
MKCRHCKTVLSHVFVDLINCPPSNDMLKPEQLNEPEVFYPLKIFTCHHCYLVQVDEMRKADSIFNSEYTYFSSFSSSWLAHAKAYVDMMVNRFGFNNSSQVIEIASNDGYLLQYFKEYNVPVLGVDPTSNTAAVAISKGIPTIIDFFGADFAQKKLVDQNIKADLILGNNVLAHVPDINDFVKGVKIALKDHGVVTFEFPHLLRLVDECQFDTIYHEHFSYLSFTVVKRIFESQGLEMFDVQELPTHGGSLRIFAKNIQDKSKEISSNVADLLKREEAAGMKTLGYYNNFQQRVENIKYSVWDFLIKLHKEGKKVIGYGAAAKGNTLINYCGIKGTDLIQFAVDASPHKQNLYLPASHIPVRDLDSIATYKPDYVIILPWNLKKEISEQLKYIRNWGGKFITFIPELSVF